MTEELKQEDTKNTVLQSEKLMKTPGTGSESSDDETLVSESELSDITAQIIVSNHSSEGII